MSARHERDSASSGRWRGVVPATKPVAPKQDAELMRALAEGDLAPLGALYDKYHEHVRQFVLHATSHAEDADDLVHEAFLTLSRIATTYDGRPSARPLLIGIAAQLVRQRKQSFARVRRSLASFGASLTTSVTQTPEHVASARQELGFLDGALAKLSEDRRLVFLMVEREGLSGDEVAKALGIPVATVWTRLHYTRNELRRSLARRAER